MLLTAMGKEGYKKATIFRGLKSMERRDDIHSAPHPRRQRYGEPTPGRQ